MSNHASKFPTFLGSHMENRMEYTTIRDLLAFLYGSEKAPALTNQLIELLEQFRKTHTIPKSGPHKIDERDALLITYGDMVGATDGEGRGLGKLHRFLKYWNNGSFNYIHILPFHPFSSDDGFSVITYDKVDERYGTWGDIEALGEDYKLVFDLVLNHGSVSSPWFQAFLAGQAPYTTWYVTRDKDYDYASVFRPRTHPLLTPFTRKDGRPVYVWTTFSADQVDYDFSNPEVLLEFITILLQYVQHGARIVRLDAIAYLWKEDGTACLHHPKTHGVVKLLRAIVDLLNLDLLILTETNVPHEENLSYFGQGDEAHLVYNFALPPLVLHAALSHDTSPLQSWASDLSAWLDAHASVQPVFLNFLASHDGVGLSPAKGLVDEQAFQQTLSIARQRGALISYKASREGPIPYELNCSYLSVVAPPELGSPAERARAFLSTQAILLALRGLPAVYFHSWVGSEHWGEGVELLGYNRAINRQKIPLKQLESELQREGSLRSRVFQGFRELLEFRQQEPSMASCSGQRVLHTDTPLFGLLRGPDSDGRYVLCLQNLGAEGRPFPDPAAFPDAALASLLTKGAEPLPPRWNGTLKAWETRWIALGGKRRPRMLSL